MPPITAVSPSLTRSLVVASLRRIVGSPRAPVLTKSASFLLTWRSIDTEQSRFETYGVTSSDRSAGTNVVELPLADTTEIGIDTPWLISAGVPLSAVIFGAEM